MLDNQWIDERWTPGRIVAHIYDTAAQARQYVAWVEIEGGEVIQRVWAYRKTKKYGTEYTEVIRRVTNFGTWYRNMYYTGIGGWQVVYQPADKKKCYYGYEDIKFDEAWFDVWDRAESNYFKGWYKTLNIAEVFKGTEYEYCGYSGGDLIDYLEQYQKNNRVEMFGKLCIFPEKSYIKKAAKDPGFIRYLREHTEEARRYGPKATIYAYNHKMEIREALDELEKRRLVMMAAPNVKRANLDPLRVMKYVKKAKGYSDYNDYLEAVLELNLDLKDTKIAFPKDFETAHDMRIEEYRTLVRHKDEERKKKDNEAFRRRMEKISDAEILIADWFFILPSNIFDLVSEGEALHHCVGKLGYDKKVINGESIIAFMRPAGKTDVPYITIEYGIPKKKVVQAHGNRNSNPTPDEWDAIQAWEKIMAKRME